METLSSQQYWDTIGFKKEFEDLLYLEKLSPFLKADSKIIEYGCGYGRLLQILWKNGYCNLLGLDFSQKMIQRGKNTYPQLDLRFLDESEKIPFENDTMDAVILSTVLCCMTDANQQNNLIEEIFRVLKKGGVIYLSDFLICDQERYKEKYHEGYKKFGTWGIYTTDEKLTVQHFTTQRVCEFLKNFDIQWFEQFDFKTMNHHPARSFHCIAKK